VRLKRHSSVLILAPTEANWRSDGHMENKFGFKFTTNPAIKISLSMTSSIRVTTLFGPASSREICTHRQSTARLQATVLVGGKCP
jgi:hypothetical protein